MSVIDFHAFINYLAKFLNFINCLLISFLHFFNDLQWSMLLAKQLVGFISVFFLYLHAIICSSSAFYVERNRASWCLTLHASPSSLETNNALKVESFFIELVESHWSLGGNQWTRNPSRTTQMNPFI